MVGAAGVAGILVLSTLLFWIWAMTGRVSGTEVSPDGFQTRHFIYFKPILARQGFWRSNWVDNDFSSQLNALSVCPIRAPQTWHLAEDNVTSIRSRDRHGEILTNLLQEGDLTERFWIKWSRNHLSQARRFWPLVQSLAFDRQYLIMPLVFRAAKENQALSPADFEVELRKVIHKDLTLAKEEFQRLGEDEKAKQMDSLLQKYDPIGGPIAPPAQLSPEPVGGEPVVDPQDDANALPSGERPDATDASDGPEDE